MNRTSDGGRAAVHSNGRSGPLRPDTEFRSRPTPAAEGPKRQVPATGAAFSPPSGTVGRPGSTKGFETR